MSNSKSPRQLPRVWKTFWALRVGDSFAVGKVTFVKTGFLNAINQGGASQLFYPWVRVRSGVLVRDARPGGKSSADTDSCNPDGTPYFGTTHGPCMDRPRVEQPHSANDIHGPTS